MKFEMNAKVFRNITERASVVLLKNGAIETQNLLLIVADTNNQKIVVKAANLQSYVVVDTDKCNITKGGRTFVAFDAVKRLYNVDGYITVEASKDCFRVKNESKQSEVVALQNVNEIEFPTSDFNKVFQTDKNNVLETLDKLSCCLSSNESRHILNGFHLANNDNKVKIEACDGFRAAVRHTEWNCNSSFDFVVPSCIAKELKKVSANKKNEDVAFLYNKKYVQVVGEDFTYTTRLLDGTYPDLQKAFDIGNDTYSFTVSASSLCKIAEEYSKYFDKINPMFICKKDCSLIAAVVTPSFRTLDKLDVDEMNIPVNLRYAINPKYLQECAAIFGKDKITIEGDVRNNGSTPWVFYGQNGYVALVLPIRPKEGLVEEVEEFLSRFNN